MKVGDVVRFRGKRFAQALGIVVSVDDSHRQTSVNVLWPAGLKSNIWVAHLEVVNENR
jgi:transcription antitermination factor NusG